MAAQTPAPSANTVKLKAQAPANGAAPAQPTPAPKAKAPLTVMTPKGPRFAKGNPGGPGNPFAARVAKLKLAALQAITPEELKKLLRHMLRCAMGGDVAAARVLLDRVLGRAPVSADADDNTGALDPDERFL